MVNRAYILLVVICIQFGPSLQQLKKLQKRLDYMELMMNSVALKTQFDISELRDAIELLTKKTEGESSAHVDVSPLDAAAIADLESEMKKTINQLELTITAIAKAVSDEKKYARQQMKLVKGTIANQSIDEIESDLMETKEINSKLEEEVQKVNSDLIATKEKLKTEVEKTNKDILELRQMIMEMKKTEFGYSSAAVTVPAQLPSTVVPVPAHLPSTVVPVPVHLPPCPDSWLKFKDTCYLYVKNVRVSWEVAKTRCTERGGFLAEPDTEEKMRYLISLAYYNTWIGGTDRLTEGTWVWSGSNRSITFFLWHPGQPNNQGGDQDCLEIGRYQLNDETCSARNKYICEKHVNL